MKDLDAIRSDAMQKVADKDGNVAMLDRPAAIRSLEREAKMMGWDAPEKIDQSVSGGTDNKHTIEIVRPDGKPPAA